MISKGRSPAVDALLPLEIPFEINTGAMARGLRKFPYPHKELLLFWRELGGKVILTSDAHKKETLGFAFEQTLLLLRELGFDSVLELCDGKLRSIIL